MNPGTTVLPLASITFVESPAMLKISSVLPTAMNLEPFTAKADALSIVLSDVLTSALITTKSGLAKSDAPKRIQIKYKALKGLLIMAKSTVWFGRGL